MPHFAYIRRPIYARFFLDRFPDNAGLAVDPPGRALVRSPDARRTRKGGAQ